MTKSRIHWWVPIMAGLLVTHVVVSLRAPAGFGLAAFGNLLQTALLGIATAIAVMNMGVARAHARLFWLAIALGLGLWLAATFMWTWLEVVRRAPVPEPFLGDVVFFIHIVPLMAALAIRPHREHTDRTLDFGGLDFVLLLLWWIYLYMFVVIPWQYVHHDVGLYGLSFRWLYALENLVFLVGVGLLCYRTRGAWRRIYAQFLVAGLTYALGSQVANSAIFGSHYYTGSLYDVPLVMGMAWFAYAGLLALQERPQPEPPTVRRSESGVIASRLAMGAVLSMPAMGIWAYVASDAPPDVVMYRVILTLVALLLMPFFVFLKQHLLDGELMRLLGISQRNFENQKRLQAQLVQAEKLASLGQLVAGAAHEINNPLTAIIGYADLLAADGALPPQKSAFVNKIGQQARRTRELVSQLLTFAKEIPTERAPVDINSLLANAIELRELDSADSTIHVERSFDSALPPVWADPNQLLQVFFHIIGNAIDVMRPTGGVVTVTSRRDNNHVVLEFADNGPGIHDPRKIFDPFYTTKPVGKGTGLGLSACYGIVQAHKGQIWCENRPQGGASFMITLPLGESTPAAGHAD
jgi:signal transduction histidine kinase